MMITLATINLTYFVVDLDGPSVRTATVKRSGCTPLVRCTRLLGAIATVIGAYPLRLDAPGAKGLALFAADPLRSEAAFNTAGTRLAARFGNQTFVRGTMAVCAVDGDELSSLNPIQVRQLTMLTAKPPVRRHWFPPGGMFQPVCWTVQAP